MICTHDDPPTCEIPRLAEGIDLIGPYHGSGYVEAKYIVGRADGQMIQLPRLLYQLAELLDGRRDCAQLAAALSAETGRGISAEQVEFLVRERLRPVGIATAPGGTDGDDAPGVPAARPDPFLALRYRAPLCSAQVTWVIAGFFQVLFRAPVLIAALGAFVALDVRLLVDGAAGRIVPAATALIYRPALTLLVLAAVVVCLSFHEFGHASACRYGGARPGTMGIGLYLIWPAVYTTVTDAYRLPRGGRLRTDLGGVYFNVLFMTGLAAAYLATGQPWLLLALVLLHLETASQFLPTVRFDGYYILSDLIGLPDLFMYLGPVVRSAVPGRPTDPRVAQLRPWVRRVITCWVLAVIPCLLLMLAAFVAVAPHTLPVLFQVIGELASATGAAVRAGETATATLGVLQLVFVGLPWIGAVLILWMIGGQIRDSVLARRGRATAPRAPEAPGPDAPSGGTAGRPWDAAEPVPARDPFATDGPGRPAGWFLVAAAPALAGAGVALAALGVRVTSAAESTVAAVTGVAAGTAAPAPDVGPVTAFGARQLAALDTLLDGLGVDGVADGVRAVLLVVAVVGSLLVWPAARRFGLSAPVAAAAVVLAAVPAPVLWLHTTIDPAVLGAVWLTLAAATLGGRPARSAVGAVALLLAVLTAPPAAAAVAAFETHRRLRRLGDGTWARRVGTAAAVAPAAFGLLTIVLAVVPHGPLRTAGSSAPLSVHLVFLVVGALGVAVAWSGRGPTAPLATGAAVLLVWSALEPAVAVSVLLPAVPALAVLVVAPLDRLLPAIRRRQGQAVVAAVVVLSVATSWPTVLSAFTPAPDRGALAAWVRDEAGDAALRTDPLTAVELVRAGVDPARLAPADGPAPPDALVARAGRPGDAAAGPVGEMLFATPAGPDGAPVAVFRPVAGGAAGVDPRAERAGVGAQPATNPALTFQGAAAGELVRGDVDARLAAVISGLAGSHRLTVAAFPAVPGEPAAAPRRTALITSVDGVPATAPGASALVVRWLASRLAPFRPARASVDTGSGALVVHFTVAATGSPS